MFLKQRREGQREREREREREMYLSEMGERENVFKLRER